MVIDIDSFLENYDNDKGSKKKEEKHIEKKKDLTPDLSFQKDVENKLTSVQDLAKKSDFQILQKIYNEVKDFDLDLTNKFLGIEKKGDETLKQIGQKYSQDYLINLKKYASSLDKTLASDLMQIESDLTNKNFTKIINLLKNLLDNYSHYPKQFISKRIKINSKIKKIEIRIYETLKVFMNLELKNIKIKIKQEIILLNKQLKKNNSKIIEETIEKLTYYMNSIPKIFTSNIIDERIYVSKIIIKAENYLEIDYRNEFEEKKVLIYNLFDKFHKYYLNHNVDKTVLTYDEILEEFNNLPEVFIEEKMKIYNQINELYSSINNLILKNNVSMFMSNYSASQIFQEVKNYLNYTKNTNKLDLENLKLFKKKLDKLPKKFDLEKKDLYFKINNYINTINKKIKTDSITKNINVKTNILSNKNIDTYKKNKNINKISNENFETTQTRRVSVDLGMKHSLKLNNFQKTPSKSSNFKSSRGSSHKIGTFSKSSNNKNNIMNELNIDFENLKKIVDLDLFLEKYNLFLEKLELDLNLQINDKKNVKIKLKRLLEQKQQNFKKNEAKNDNIVNNSQNDILLEINNYYEKLKLENNPIEIKKYYQKILFYLNLLHIKKSRKDEILLKVKTTLMKKKIN